MEININISCIIWAQPAGVDGESDNRAPLHATAYSIINEALYNYRVFISMK